MVIIRPEQPEDIPGIHHVNAIAFGQPNETDLVEAGLTACRETDYGVVVVLGHPDYYPRFGFTPSKPYGIVWEHDAPEEAFMVRELQDGALVQTHGVVRYRPEFEAV